MAQNRHFARKNPLRSSQNAAGLELVLSVSIPPELAEPVRAAVVATVEQERDRLKAELEAL